MAKKYASRKKSIFRMGTLDEKVTQLIEALKEEGIDLPKAYDGDGTITGSDRVVSIGNGLAKQEDMTLIQSLAQKAGAEVGSSRPVAEAKKWVPFDHYVGVSGKKFTGSLYMAIGISGKIQHLLGIEEAGIVVAINKDPNAPIFKNADYGIIGDLYEIVPVLIEKLS